MIGRSLTLTALLLTASSLATADDAIKRCRALSDPAARLACYDAIPMPDTGRTAGSASPRSAAEPARNEPPPRVPVESFGLPRLAPAEPEAITSSFAEATDGWRPGSQLRLANGQVWQIVDDSRGFVPPGARQVRVRRGALGAYYLEIEGINHSPRVRRVQ